MTPPEITPEVVLRAGRAELSKKLQSILSVGVHLPSKSVFFPPITNGITIQEYSTDPALARINYSFDPADPGQFNPNASISLANASTYDLGFDRRPDTTRMFESAFPFGSANIINSQDIPSQADIKERDIVLTIANQVSKMLRRELIQRLSEDPNDKNKDTSMNLEASQIARIEATMEEAIDFEEQDGYTPISLLYKQGVSGPFALHLNQRDLTQVITESPIKIASDGSVEIIFPATKKEPQSSLLIHSDGTLDLSNFMKVHDATQFDPTLKPPLSRDYLRDPDDGLVRPELEAQLTVRRMRDAVETYVTKNPHEADATLPLRRALWQVEM